MGGLMDRADEREGFLKGDWRVEGFRDRGDGGREGTLNEPTVVVVGGGGVRGVRK